MRLDRLLSTFAAGFLVVGLCACGAPDAKHDVVSKDSAPTEAAAADATPAAAPVESGQQPLSVADIDRWDKGMAGELQAVDSANYRLKQAKTGEDSTNAMMALQDMATVEAGAKAAGVDQDRYQLIRTNLSSAAGYLAPQIGGLDPAKLSAEQRAEMQQSNAAQLEEMKDVVPPDVVAALTPRAAELRSKDVKLTLARVKGAGMGPR